MSTAKKDCVKMALNVNETGMGNGVVVLVGLYLLPETAFLIKLPGSVRRPAEKQSMCTDHNTQETEHSFRQTEGGVGPKPDCTARVHICVCVCVFGSLHLYISQTHS